MASDCRRYLRTNTFIYIFSLYKTVITLGLDHSDTLFMLLSVRESRSCAKRFPDAESSCTFFFFLFFSSPLLFSLHQCAHEARGGIRRKSVQTTAWLRVVYWRGREYDHHATLGDFPLQLVLILLEPGREQAAVQIECFADRAGLTFLKRVGKHLCDSQPHLIL